MILYFVQVAWWDLTFVLNLFLEQNQDNFAYSYRVMGLLRPDSIRYRKCQDYIYVKWEYQSTV